MPGSPQKLCTIDTSHSIREACEPEHFLISVLLANAFLQVWNHNWFMNINTPGVPIELPVEPLRQEQYQLSIAQEKRRKFYHSLVKLVLLSGGQIF